MVSLGQKKTLWRVRLEVVKKIFFPIVPWDTLTKVAPFGLLPSVRLSPVGSFELGKSTFKRALQIMSSIAACRAVLPIDLLQTSPWCPPGSVTSPHWQRCDAQC